MTHTTLSKPAKSNKQIQEYLSAVDKGMSGRFVVPNGKGWYVRKPHSQKGTLFPTKREAIAHAKQELAKTEGKLFVFDSKGNLVNS